MFWMTLIMSMMITSTISFMMMTHPMSMGFNLLIQAMLISALTGMFQLNFWYSYILFLVMVGGMLVLFIYMTSTAYNEKFHFSMVTTMVLMFLMIISLILISKMSITINEMINSQSLTTYTWQLSLTKFFSLPQNILTLFMMMYLFLALLAVVKITKTEEGALKSN
uniref:NADH-ubiquinone oxidoreductase chain 6 n=1 Tax=Trachys auricollis TaxID=2705174 RepID=A0A6C0AAL8_9COLE|nr:NADH dehydrogenase subunit 6 [Trachys auricollis]QHS71069.1 NADH dehydrogenase subunit 6 [Trachys auricollis]